MRKENRQKNKVYRSMVEIERDFFPILYKERLEKERLEKEKSKPGAFGIELATELLENIRQQLTK